MAIKMKVRKAGGLAAEAGPTAMLLVRYCDELSGQIDNLEKVASPGKKDFGAFSGLVACALFLPLFLGVSSANWLLDSPLSEQALLGPSFVLALIGGFGSGALKYTSIIFPSRAGGQLTGT